MTDGYRIESRVTPPTYVGSESAPVTSASTARPAVTGPVTWVTVPDLVLTNKQDGDIQRYVPVAETTDAIGSSYILGGYKTAFRFQAKAAGTLVGLSGAFASATVGTTARALLLDAAGTTILAQSPVKTIVKDGVTPNRFTFDTPYQLVAGTDYWVCYTSTALLYPVRGGATTIGSGRTYVGVAVAGNETRVTNASPSNDTDVSGFGSWTTYASQIYFWGMFHVVPPGFVSPDVGPSIVDETTTTRTLVASDADKVIECTNAAATTVTVPPNSSVPFPIGTTLSVYAAGAGGVTIAQGAGVTIRNLAALAQYEETSLRKRATNEWVQA